MSSPSLSPNASTTAAGRRMARLSPHFATFITFSCEQPSRPRMRARLVFAKVLLRYLADRRLRQCVANFHGADHFMLSEPLLQKRLHFLERERGHAGFQLDEGLRRLAAIVVGNSDDAHFLDRGVLIDGLLDVARIDVE